MYDSIISNIDDSIWDSLLSDFAGDVEVGKVVQVVSSYTGNVVTGATTGMANDDSIPLITEGLQVFSVPYTALANANRLLIFCSASFGFSAAARTRLAMFDTLNGVPSNAVAASTDRDPQGNGGSSLVLNTSLVATSTSARTFTFRIAGDINLTVTLNGIAGTRRLGGVHSSGVTIIEVEP